MTECRIQTVNTHLRQIDRRLQMLDWEFALLQGNVPSLGTPSLSEPHLTIAAQYPLQTSGLSAGGLAYDGLSLWISAQGVGFDQLLHYSLNGEILNTVFLGESGNVGGGMTFDGEFLYVLNYSNAIMLKNDIRFTGTGTIQKLKYDGTFVQQFNLEREHFNTFGLTYANGSFYYGFNPSMTRTSTLCKLNSDFQMVSKKEVPFYIRGLAWDGKYLWVSSIQKIYKIDEDYRILAVYSSPVELADIEFVNGSLWAVGHNRNMLYKFELSEIERNDNSEEAGR